MYISNHGIQTTHHVTAGFGFPTHRHSNDMLVPSSVCRMTGRSVKVGLIPSSGTGASSPISWDLHCQVQTFQNTKRNTLKLIEMSHSNYYFITINYCIICIHDSTSIYKFIRHRKQYSTIFINSLCFVFSNLFKCEFL